jgi:hypothetical protein
VVLACFFCSSSFRESLDFLGQFFLVGTEGLYHIEQFLVEFDGIRMQVLLLTLRQKGLSVISQHPVKVLFRGECVGDFYADIFVEAIEQG